MSRAVHIKGVEYCYKIGKSNVVVRLPSGKQVHGRFSAVTGLTWDEIEEMDGNGSFTISPAQVKSWLIKRLEHE